MSYRAFTFGLIVAALLVIGLYRAKDGARESSAEIILLEAQIAEAYRQKAILEAELSHMSREEWIEEYARKELGMAPPKASQIANDSNLDLLVGRVDPKLRVNASAADLPITQESKKADPTAAEVNVPVTDASSPKPKEGAP